MLIPGQYKLDVFLGDGMKDMDTVIDELVFEVKDNFENEILSKLKLENNKLHIPEIKWKLRLDLN
jgi:hypothetical protein